MGISTSTFVRRAERDDLDTIIEWVEDPDFLHFLYGDVTRSPKQVREQVVGLLGRSAGQTLPGGIYLIIDSPDGPIGLLSLQNISWRNRSCNVDLYIGKKDARAGMMAGVAFFRVMEYCFDELNLHRIQAYIYAFNTASWRLLEKSGAKRELELPDHVFRDGQGHAMYCYGLLRREFYAFRESLGGRADGVSLSGMIATLRGTTPPEPPAP